MICILIVDDHEHLRGMIRELLEAEEVRSRLNALKRARSVEQQRG